MSTFNYLKAAQVLAYGQLFKKSAACIFYNVTSCSYDRWKNRLKHRQDEKLVHMYEEALTKMTEKWEEENAKALVEGFRVMNTAFANHPFDKKPKSLGEKRAWGYNVDCTGKAIKSMGDLATASKVLDQEDELDSDQQS